MEGKEVRFGIADSALFATVTTDASCGAINSWHDSFTPLGGMVPLANIMLSETVFGGVGAGLYGILIYVVLSVFIAGLMVGRTPEYLGKKIEAYDVKMAMLVTLVFPLIILVLAGISSVEGFRHLQHQQRRPARPYANALCVHVDGGKQWFGVWRIERKHSLVQPGWRGNHVGRAFFHDHPHAGDCGKSCKKEICSAIAGHVSGNHSVVQRFAGRRDSHRRRTDIFPGLKPWANTRTPFDVGRKDFLRT